ncbi:MAG: HAD hydrolase-like protein, partial [Candidatus Competibacterales bacterium]
MSFAYPRRGPPEGVLFDLDGTLLDTAPDLLAALAKVAQEAGYPWPEKNLRAAVTGGSRG